MARYERMGFRAAAAVALLVSALAVRLGAGVPAESGLVLLGDDAACAKYELAGPGAGSLVRIVRSGSAEPLAGPVFPWLASESRLVSPAGHWDDQEPEGDSLPVLAMREGGEEALLSLPDGLVMRTRLVSAGHGVWLWELVVTNTGSRLVVCQPGLSLGTSLTNQEGVWQAAEGMAQFRTAAGVFVVGAVSGGGVVWTAPGTGPLYKNGPKAFGGLGALHGTIRLSPATGERFLFVLAAGTAVDETKRRCLEWMRLDGMGKAMSRAKAVWETWLSEGRTPLFTDRTLQVSLLRRLRSLAAAAVCPGLAPRDARDLLDCAEAMRTFGRDREAAAWLAAVPAAIGGSVERLARTPGGRDVLLRYASLVSRQTIASGRLAGELDLVDQGLAAVSRVVTASNAQMLPVDAVQLEAALHDGALLMRLARRPAVSERMLTNAGKARVLADRLWSPEARAWTNAQGMPDPRVVADAGLQAGGDVRYDLQYRRLRPFGEILSPRDQALLVVAAARAFDLAWYRAALVRWEKTGSVIDPLVRAALWLRMVAEGSLAGSLPEEDVCSEFRLETLYRIILEMRHASTRVASSFVFRDLRSRIRQHLERIEGRDAAFVSTLGVSLGELRSEIVRHGLPGELEQRQVFSRLNRVDRMLAGMIVAAGKTVLDTGVAVSDGRYVLESEQASVELPEGWSVARREKRDERLHLAIRAPEQAGDQPLEGRVVIGVACGTRTIRVAGSFVLHHPRPLALHLVRDSARFGRAVLENRGSGDIRLRLVQSSPEILEAGGPLVLRPGNTASLPLSLARQGSEARLMLLAETAEGREIRLERTVVLSEVIEPDSRWLRTERATLVSFALTREGVRDLKPDRDGVIRISKTVAGLKNRGELVLGLQAGSAPWDLDADGVRVQPRREGGWLWYHLPALGSSHLGVYLADRKAAALFAAAPKKLIVGYRESE